MNRVCMRITQDLNSSIASRVGYTYISRSLSTGAAIHRGIRKSGSGYRREELSGDGTSSLRNATNGTEEDGSKRYERIMAKERRPNHQAKQDVEDMAESTRLKMNRKTPRQLRYMEGGIRRASNSSVQTFSTRNSQFQERSSQDRRHSLGRYDRLKQEPRKIHGSDSQPYTDEPSFRGRNQRVYESKSREGDDPPFRGRDRRIYESRSREGVGSSDQKPYRSLAESRPSPKSEQYQSTNNFRQGTRDGGSYYDSGTRRQLPQERDVPIREPKLALSVPYTTPASEFLFGTSVILAALQSQRRKLYKLYMYQSENRHVLEQDKNVRKFASASDVEVVSVQGDWLRLMDKLSSGRPHNGYILEASPLPKLPVTGLLAVSQKLTTFSVALDHQSREDKHVNGVDHTFTCNTGTTKNPFLLMLDGILDPGNLGGILRSAFFLGVDGIIIANRNCAPLSPVVLKASAGAAESIPLMSVNTPAAFIENSQEKGWKFYAAVAPPSKKNIAASSTHISATNLKLPARNHPCVLMLGGEGEGLRWNLQKKADYTVSIDGRRKGQGGVDSLNVSVAAGLLCEAFLQEPATGIEERVRAPAPNIQQKPATAQPAQPESQKDLF